MTAYLSRGACCTTVVALIGFSGGCGGTSDAERFGRAASPIQGCDQELTIKRVHRPRLWPDARAVEQVICGKDVGIGGTMLNVATYPSADAADAAAGELSRRRLLCVVGESVIESWMYPYDGSNEKKADRVAHRWAREFCGRVGGRSIGHWHAWEFSLEPRSR